jgi:hypothetical protein
MIFNFIKKRLTPVVGKNPVMRKIPPIVENEKKLKVDRLR